MSDEDRPQHREHVPYSFRIVCGFFNVPHINFELAKQSIDTLLTLSQLRWSGHLVHMCDDRLPKQLFYSELSELHRLRGRPTLRFKDTLKKSLQNCSIATAHWETTTSNRRVWKQLTRKGAAAYEQAKRRAHAEKRAATKAGTESRGSSIPCHVCGRICASEFGLRSHLWVHR